MNYYLDTEFLEGPQKKRILGIPYEETKNTIDLISIGIVCEDGREYYAISKDFNLKEAWNRYDLKPMSNKGGIGDTPTYKKDYWIRDNVLLPIYKNWVHGDMRNHFAFTYSNMKALIKSRGKTNKEISEEIIKFTNDNVPVKTIGSHRGGKILSEESNIDLRRGYTVPKFHAYYADYDWVVFCWLFGKMNDLPKGFPKYCIDLKQIMDDKINNLKGERIIHYLKEKRFYGFNGEFSVITSPATKTINYDNMNFNQKLNFVKKEINSYPKEENEHNALDDARWNKKLHEFLNNLE